MIKDLKEAIEHTKEKAKELSDKAYAEYGKTMTEEQAYECNECAAEQEQLAKWLEELAERREADRWIPVTERLPEDTEDVLVYDGQDMFVAWCGSYNRWHSSDDKLDKNTPITHWRPLPKPYESEDK